MINNGITILCCSCYSCYSFFSAYIAGCLLQLLQLQLKNPQEKRWRWLPIFLKTYENNKNTYEIIKKMYFCGVGIVPDDFSYTVYFVVLNNDNDMYTELEIRPFTIEEIHARIEQSKRDSAAGLGVDTEEMLSELEKEFAFEDQLEMAEISEIA